MDFFERQEDAQRTSSLLVAFFAGAALLMLASVYAVLLALAWAADVALPPPFWWQPLLLLAAVLLTGGLLGGSAWHALRRLRAQGGVYVAHRLGARPLRPGPPGEDTLQNVVEEMAIAAGLPAPWIYILENQPGINALAAGYAPDDAVLIATDGALTQLSRDALQSVVAHEFSHILYGDMRLNTRLLGLLEGLLLLPRFGAALLRWLAPRDAGSCLVRMVFVFLVTVAAATSYFSHGPSETSLAARLATVAGLLVLLLAATLLLGGVGALVGRLLQRAVARQREFLADAAAVQFTRNPGALREAFQRIDALDSRSRIIGQPRLATARHFFFGDPQPPPFFQHLLSSHPVLSERLAALPDGLPPTAGSPVAAAGTAAKTDSSLPEAFAAEVGNPSGAHLDYGHALHEALPLPLREAAHDPLGAEALVYGLLLHEEEDVRQRQQATLAAQIDEAALEEIRRLRPLLRELPARARLPLVELLAPALRALSPTQLQPFRQSVRALAATDQSLSVFEFSLAQVVNYWLTGDARPRRQGDIRDVRLAASACQTLLSALACAGHDDARDARRAFATGAHHLADAAGPRDDSSENGLLRTLDLQTDVAPQHVDEALDRLMQLAPVARHQVLDASARCVMADGTATIQEAELLRVVATLLECPLPPFLSKAK